MTSTGKELKITRKDGYAITYEIAKNHFTPYGYCCEWTNYYEIAMHSWYLRINKKDFSCVSNRVDVDNFKPDALYIIGVNVEIEVF